MDGTSSTGTIVYLDDNVSFDSVISVDMSNGFVSKAGDSFITTSLPA